MPRTIKRYENRKLYDTEASAYISLTGLADLVRSGETVVILDNATGEDLTVQTLTQVILEEGRRGRPLLSSDLLHDVLQRGSHALESGMSSIRHGVDDLVQSSMRRVQTFLHRPERAELSDLRDQLGRLEDMLRTMLDAADDDTTDGEDQSETEKEESS